MSERDTDLIVAELRASAPPAPEALRRRVAEIAATERPRGARRWPALGVQRSLAIGAAAFVVLTAAAVVVPRVGDGPRQDEAARPAPSAAQAERPRDSGARRLGPAGGAAGSSTPAADKALTTLPPARRLQDYRATIRLRVADADDLSAKAQRAMRDTRRMGGFVASVDFAAVAAGGNATLVLRVPMSRIQEAVARFSELGTILAQQVAIDDLQPQADQLAASISRLRGRIAALEAKARRVGLTPDEQFQLDAAREQLRTVTQQRAQLVRQARYATVRVELTTAKSDRREQPGPFAAFWDDAKKILTTEAVWLLYALVVAGPFVLLAALLWLAERARRRRSADALLAQH